MDFGELDDALDVIDDDAYIPTFNKGTRNTNPKPLLKNNSTKSIDQSLGLNAPQTNNRINIKELQKDNQKDVTTFEDFFKQQNPSLPKENFRRETNFQIKQPIKQIKPSSNKNDFNINGLLEDEDDSPIVGRRGMKPPISRKNQDGRSVVSRGKQENRSFASVNEGKKQNKEDQRPLFDPQPQTNFRQVQNFMKIQKNPLTRQETGISRQTNQEIKKHFSGAEIDIKSIVEGQLKQQRDLNEKLMRELQESHKSQIERLKKLHEQQIKRKLQLKDIQIKNIKQHYDMKFKILNDRNQEQSQITQASRKLSEGVKALQTAQQEFKNKSSMLDSSVEAKSDQIKSYELFISQKQKVIQQKYAQLQRKQRQFKEEKQLMWTNLEKQRKNNENYESRLIKRERELEERCSKKQRTLQSEYDQKFRKVSEQESRLRFAKMQLQQDKLRFNQEKQDNATKNRKWQENRMKLMEDLNIQKTKLQASQHDLNCRRSDFQMKQNDLILKEKQVLGKLKMMEHTSSKSFENSNGFRNQWKRTSELKTPLMQDKKWQDTSPSVFEKNLKQLKDEYLRNIGQL